MFNQLTTPYNPGIDAFFDFWEPEASTLHWTKAEASIGGGTAGSFFGMGPIAAIKAAGIPVPASKIAAFAERMRHNFIGRGILNPEIFAPNFDALSPLPNLYDWLHFNIGLLRDLHAAGFKWAGQYLSRILLSNANNLLSYFANPGKNHAWKEGEPLWGTNGRHRNPAGSIVSLCDAIAAYKQDGSPSAIASVYAAGTLLDRTLEVLAEQAPMPDLGQGDSPPISLGAHYRSFMTAHLCAALKRASYISPKAKALLEKFRAILRKAHRGPAAWAYDQACDENGEPIASDKEIVNVGVAGTNQWIPAAFEPTDVEFIELLNDAKAKNWPSKYPMTMLAQFGTLG